MGNCGERKAMIVGSGGLFSQLQIWWCLDTEKKTQILFEG